MVSKQTLSTRLGTNEKPTYCICVSFFLFFIHTFLWLLVFPVGLVHCSRDPQTFFLTKFSLKMSLTALFTHLKINLLQCFQFSVLSKISYIQIHLTSHIYQVIIWRNSLTVIIRHFEFKSHKYSKGLRINNSSL